MIRVLVVEDDPMLAEIHRRFVEDVHGFTVVGIAGDGVKALDVLKGNSVDLVILDVYLPKMDGLDLFREMRKLEINSDVILVTAAKEVEQVETALKLGAFDYLVKPFEFERLKRSLSHYKERLSTLDSRNVVGQSELDKIFSRDKVTEINELPKGLHMITLERVQQVMEENIGAFVDIETIAGQMDMSKVTARRYLEYLAKIGKIEIEMSHGSRGRPSYKYRMKG